jgi:hypothetical protein
MKYIAIYLDCCLSSYFQGFNGPVLNVPVDSETTYGELCGALTAELQVYDSTYYEATLNIDTFDWEEAEKAIIQLFSGVGVDEKVAEARYAERYRPVEDWIQAVASRMTTMSYDDWKEACAEDAESCYFYIGFRKAE